MSVLRPRVLSRRTLLPALLVTLGCAMARPIVHLTPTGDGVVWVSGVGYMTAESPELRVAVGFVRDENGLLGVRVEAQNQGQASILFGPEALTFQACRIHPGAPPACGVPVPVTDPEQSLLAIDAREREEGADHRNEQAWDSATYVLTSIGALVSIGSRHHREAAEDAAEASYQIDRDEAVHQSKVADLAAQRQWWETEALRRTTIAPGEGIAGMVYFPGNLETQMVRLHVTVGASHFVFVWQEQVIQPRFADL